MDKKRIILQAPDGLKPEIERYIRSLEEEGREVILSARASYGACDLCIEEAKMLNANILHVGHAPFPKLKQANDVGTNYILEEKDVDVADIVEKIEEIKDYAPFALVAIIQYVHALEEIKQKCAEKGIEMFIKKGYLAYYPGQVLGCDGSAADVKMAKAVLFIGDGMFHAKALPSDKPTFCYSPSDKKLFSITPYLERWAKKKKGLIAKALYAKKWGVLVSTKPGQKNIELAEKLINFLINNGFKAWIIIGDELNPFTIANFTFIDAFITTACPRLVDESENIGKPILDLNMFEEWKRIKLRCD
jgi:2-(3-amino-3-carboxypropyl)histidine synthase